MALLWVEQRVLGVSTVGEEMEWTFVREGLVLQITSQG